MPDLAGQTITFFQTKKTLYKQKTLKKNITQEKKMQTEIQLCLYVFGFSKDSTPPGMCLLSLQKKNSFTLLFSAWTNHVQINTEKSKDTKIAANLSGTLCTNTDGQNTHKEKLQNKKKPLKTQTSHKKLKGKNGFKDFGLGLNSPNKNAGKQK